MKLRSLIKDVYEKGFFHLFSANTLIHVIEFTSQLFVAWILMADDMGRIKSFQVYAAIAIIFAGLGFNTSVLKLCSQKNESVSKEGLFFSAFAYTLLTSFVTLILFIIIAKFNLLSRDARTNDLFVYYAFSIPVITLNNLLIAYFQALKEFKKVSKYLIFARIVHVVGIILLTYLFKIEGFIGGVVIGFLFSFILLLIQTKMKLKLNKSIKDAFFVHWEVAKFAFLGNVISSINLYLDFIILNHIVKNAELLGQYGFALTLMTGLRVFGYTVQQFVTPFYSEKSHQFAILHKIFIKSERIFILISFIFSILVAILAPLFIHFVFGGKYDVAIEYFIYLTIAWLIRSWYTLKGPLLLSLGFVRVNFYNSVILLSLSIVPYWLLIQEYKILGALYAQCLTALLGAIIVWISFRRIIKKNKQIKQI